MAIGKSRPEEDQSSLIRFYKIVLGWDFLRLHQDSTKLSKGGRTLGLKKVKDTYSDVDDYLSTFEPLLFEEVKAGIVKRDGEGDEISVGKELMGLIQGFNESEGFYFLDVIVVHEGAFSQNDLLLLSKGKFGSKPKDATYAFAFVEHRQTESVRLRVFLDGEVKGTNVDEVKISTRLKRFRSLFNEESCTLHIQKVCSLSTIIREFVALHSITSLPTMELILKAADCDAGSTDRAWKIPQQLMQYIENSHNSSQLEAILAGLSRKPFVLIQGPPGTGKTQTILGLLSALLHSTPARMHTKQKLHKKQWPELAIDNKYHHWNLASPWLSGNNKRDEVMPVDGDDGFFPITGSELKPEVVDSSRKYRVRVLVCAPSNSALDEIVLRVINRGIHDENDQAYNPKIVRIGLKAHHSVQSVSMDYLVEQKLAGIGDYLTADKQKQGGASAVDRDSIRASILDEAVIVFSTLSFSGSNILSKMNRTFDVVIIDEAAQAVESATLIPLSSGCKQVFLVGDPVQLPATVLSPAAQKLGYGMSLFKRFQQAGYPVVMLTTQYRMHPEIRSFPSKEFYADALEDGADIKDKTTRPWHDYRCYGPFCFFDLHDSKESQPTGDVSWMNVDEVEFVLLLYQKLVSSHPALKSSSMLAIITPYVQQMKLFRQKFLEMFGVEHDKFVDINTVDGFQGREKDVAIFSCVRSNEEKKIGFVSDFRRMNVGITRARSSVLVVGSASTLKEDEHWGNLVESAEKRDCLFQVSKPYDSFFSKDKMKSMLLKKDLGEVENTGFVVDDYGNADEADAGLPDEYEDGEDEMGGDDD